MLSIVELNAILYYADYISLKGESKTVTDNCKYYFIYGNPINSAYIVDSKPFYDEENPYFILAYEEYEMIKSKYGIEGVLNFLGGICNLAALGCINAHQMLNCIHYYSSKYERKEALKKYENWINSQFYTHLEINEKGDPQRTKCTRYVAHAEIGTKTNPLVNYTTQSPRKRVIHERTRDLEEGSNA